MSRRVERWAWRTGAVALAAGMAAALIAGPWNFLVGSVTGSTATTRHAPCLPGREVPIMDSPHVSPAELESARYNSLPPTSGPHFAFTPATGVYTEPMSEGLSVHAMEHGHIVIQYAADTPKETVEALRRLARRHAGDVIVAPYPKLANGIALTAWGRIDLLDTYDDGRAVDFINKLRNRYIHGWTRPTDCP